MGSFSEAVDSNEAAWIKAEAWLAPDRPVEDSSSRIDHGPGGLRKLRGAFRNTDRLERPSMLILQACFLVLSISKRRKISNDAPVISFDGDG